MTHDQIMAMTEQELVEAALKAQGWEWNRHKFVWIEPVNKFEVESAPDYLHDLNACFELLEGKTYCESYNAKGDEPFYVGLDEDGLEYKHNATGASLNLAILRSYLQAVSNE